MAKATSPSLSPSKSSKPKAARKSATRRVTASARPNGKNHSDSSRPKSLLAPPPHSNGKASSQSTAAYQRQYRARLATDPLLQTYSLIRRLDHDSLARVKAYIVKTFRTQLSI
jgi:hypothetical protein